MDDNLRQLLEEITVWGSDPAAEHPLPEEIKALAERLTEKLRNLRTKSPETEGELDIDAQIALLKQELSKEPDRIPYSQETYRKVLQTSLLPLTEKFLRKVCQFDDLFLDARCWVQFEQGAKQNAVAARREDRFAMVTSLLEKSERRDICIGYNLVSFKKAGVHSFDCTTFFRIVFKGFTYEVLWLQKKTEHLYSTSLREDQTTEIVNALISSVLRTIEQERVKKG